MKPAWSFACLRRRSWAPFLSTVRGLGLTVCLLLWACCSSAEPQDTGDDPPGWSLRWHDEFDGDGLPDPSKWSYDVGAGGWGNNELQDYRSSDPASAQVKNGVLEITASLVGAGSSKQYRSARLKTKGKGDWKYGRIEVRAKLPAGRGTWPAIWMMPTASVYGRWPRSGEIDIMEHVGFDPGIVHATVHTEAFNHGIGTQKGATVSLPDASSAFHTYRVEWTEDRMDFFADDTRHFSFENSGAGSAEWPFDQPFHLILNIAVGGNWGGQQGVDDAIFPQKLVVDYVRVYEKE